MPGPYSANAFTLAPASPQAAAISRLFVGTLVFLGAILVLATFLVIYAIIRYRDRPGAPEARQNFGSRKLETVWTIVPILSLIVLTGIDGVHDERRRPAHRGGRSRPQNCCSSMVVGNLLPEVGRDCL
jgi:hypothetical protein